jgi:O-6-methylguanine DNA methyltransferase
MTAPQIPDSGATTAHDAAIGDQLSALGASAPTTLLPRTLIGVGLADAYAAIDSPIGPLFVAFNGIGVAAVEQAPDAAAFEADHVARSGRPAYRVAALPSRLAGAIARRLAGDRRVRIDLDLRGRTAFERDVWTKALEIPRGEVRPYGWIAAEIGRPKAVRAVGTALGHNPVPLIVPCHRVVRSDGMLGNYSLGGPHNKRAILSAEGLDPDELEAQARAGVRLIGSDTTRIYCLPSCHAARRIVDRHRVTFRSPAAGLKAGYRACRQCRPGSIAAA